jgi:uncharacterized protein (DUF2235 family)
MQPADFRGARCAMARKLVVCCDGTWNTPRTDTNIYQTYRFLRERLGNPVEVTPKAGILTCTGRIGDGSDVLLFYDQGVGSEWFDKLVGGAAGVGLSDNVRDAYHFLAQNFVPGSEIYVFGFSRGAYTARSLCGFIKAAGLLDRPSVKDVWRAYMDLYATGSGVIARPQGWSVDTVRSWLVSKAGDAVGHLGGADVAALPRHAGVKVRFIGVYDTVGALGVPLAGLTKFNEPIVGFHDTTLGDLVEHAVQALAVDERRGPYVPTLWTLKANASLLAGQSVLQVWFPGVHSDIGGGYPDKGIGNITLDFMLKQAARRGLLLDPGQPTPPLKLEELPAQHDSFDKTWRELSDKLKLIPEGVRSIGPTLIGPDGQPVTVAREVCLHASLVNRLGKRCVTMRSEGNVEAEYRPKNVTADTLPVFGG